MDSTKWWNGRGWLWLECALLFGALPVVLTLLDFKRSLFAILWIMAICCLIVWRKQNDQSVSSLFHFKAIPHTRWKPTLVRFAICAVALALFTAVHNPDRLLQFPLEKPAMWVVVMMLYPILSVIPQEIIYRVFFFDRYKSIFKTDRIMIGASALAFGHGHFMFNNSVAYFMCMAGGWIFADTYARTRSMPLVWLEHALYGCFIFTIGLGWYFYTGAAHMHNGVGS